MTDIIIKNKKDDILVKDCMDFIPLNDGTMFGDKRYCGLSLECKQINMASDWLQYMDEHGNITMHDYFCTGKYAIWEERSKDEEVE